MQRPAVGSRLWMGVAGGAITPSDELRALGTSLWVFDADYLSDFKSESTQQKPAYTSNVGEDPQVIKDTIRRAKMVGCIPVISTNYSFLPENNTNTTYTPISLSDATITVNAISPWCPALTKLMTERWTNLSKIVAPDQPSILIGVYGENGQGGCFTGTKELPVLDNGTVSMKKVPAGFWWGDPDAAVNFRKSMLSKYGSLDKLNTAWGTDYASEDQVTFPTGPDSGERYWLDSQSWYINGFAYIADVQARIAKRLMPNSPLFLPAGMNIVNPRYGSDISAMAKVAGRNKCVMVLEADRYSADGRLHNLLGAAAAKFYKADWVMGRRTSGEIKPSQRLFDVIANGGSGIIESQSLIGGTSPSVERNLRFLDAGTSIVDSAILLPTSQLRLLDNKAYTTLSQQYELLRDRFPMDVIDERLVADGALPAYKTLFVLDTYMLEPSTIQQIGQWVKAGGIFVTNCEKAIRIPGGSTDEWTSALGSYQPTTIEASFTPQMVGNGYQLELQSDEGRVLSWGDWAPSQQANSAGWSGFTKKGGLKLPIKSSNSYGLSITARGEKGSRTTVVLDNKPVGVLDSEGVVVYKFAINPKPVKGICQLQFVNSGRSGHEIKTIGIHLVGASDYTGAAGVWRFEKPTKTIAKSIFHPIAKGGIAILPVISSAHGQEYVRSLCQEYVYGRSAVVSQGVDAPNIDGVEDRVESSLFTDRVVMYNRGSKDISRTLALSGLKKLGVIDDEIGGDVQIPSDGMNAVSVNARPIELMLGCEQFINMQGNKPEMLQGCLPDGAANCVMLKDTAKITTRFPISETADYRIYVRALRNGEPASIDAKVDGTALKAAGQMRTGDVWYLGTVKLTKGTHLLELNGRKYQTIYADFILLSGDKRVEGFRIVNR